MSLNRYRLKHLSKSGHQTAKRVIQLLNRPDRLISVILIGNNFVNILASSIATLIALRLWGDSGIAIATLLLTLVILIFAEVTPKTLAAVKPELIAFPASYVLTPLLYLLYPLVAMVNSVSSLLLRFLGVDAKKPNSETLNREELRTVVNESASLIPRRHLNMLISVLDLEHVTVDDIMVARGDVFGVDLEDDLQDILDQLSTTQYTRIPIYRNSLDNPLGILHARHLMRYLNSGSSSEQNKSELLLLSEEPYYVHTGTGLHQQLAAFQNNKRRLALVVDEYGVVMGIVTLEDILEEIVGEFTTDQSVPSQYIRPQADGSFIIDGSATIREVNKALKWDLPADGPKTISGLITERLETIPKHPVGLQIGVYQFETLKLQENIVAYASARKTDKPLTQI